MIYESFISLMKFKLIWWAKDDEGIPFWGGSRRRPVPLYLNIENVNHKEFIDAASKLWLRVYKSAEKTLEIFKYNHGNCSSAELKDEIYLKNSLLSKIKELNKETRKSLGQPIEPMVKAFLLLDNVVIIVTFIYILFSNRSLRKMTFH